MAYDQAQSPRLGQRTPVENPGVRLVTLAELPEIAYRGQLIFNTTSDFLMVYTGVAWQTIGDESGTDLYVQSSTPSGANIGDQWYNPSTGEMKVFTGAVWVAPALAPDSVNTPQLVNGAVGATKLADNAVGAAALAAAALTTKHTITGSTYQTDSSGARMVIADDLTNGLVKFIYDMGELRSGYVNVGSNGGRPMLSVASGSMDNNAAGSAILQLTGNFSGGTGKRGDLNCDFYTLSVTETSALKYKEDVSDLPYDKDELLALRPVQYRLKATGEAAVGFIAEEAFEAGADAWVHFEDGGVEGFNYTRWTAALQQICREQQTEIDELKAQLSSVLERLDALESME